MPGRWQLFLTFPNLIPPSPSSFETPELYLCAASDPRLQRLEQNAAKYDRPALASSVLDWLKRFFEVRAQALFSSPLFVVLWALPDSHVAMEKEYSRERYDTAVALIGIKQK